MNLQQKLEDTTAVSGEIEATRQLLQHSQEEIDSLQQKLGESTAVCEDLEAKLSEIPTTNANNSKVKVKLPHISLHQHQQQQQRGQQTNTVMKITSCLKINLYH